MPAKHTIAHVAEIFMQYGYVLLADDYKNNKQRLLFYCPDCDSEQAIRLNDLTQGHLCPNCGNMCKADRFRELAETQKKDSETVREELRVRNLEMVGEYKNARTKIRFKCSRHPKEIQEARINDLRKYQCCRLCAIDKQRLPYDEVQRRFIEKGYHLLTNDYRNSTTKLLYICDKHPDSLQQTDISSITQDHGCYFCGLERTSGKNHYRYNPNLTQEDRKYKRKYDLEIPRWRREVFKRDYFTCQICGVKGRPINAHHKEGFNWCKERRYDVSNGVTLCTECHKEFHRKYGYGDNTEQQFEEFKGESQRGVR